MHTNSKTVVLGMARTPFGKLGGALAPLSATTLGAVALTAAIERSKIDPSEIDHVSFGEVLQAGVGQNPARQVLFKSGLAKTVTADTVNKVCASGMLAIVNAMRSINAGANSVVAAGGMESMSNAPYLLRDARWGYRFGDGALVDAMIYDGLWDQYFPMTMATQGSKVASELALTREEQDALRSRAIVAPRPRTPPAISPTKSFRSKSRAKPKIKSSSIVSRDRARFAFRYRPARRAASGSTSPRKSSRSTTRRIAPFVTGEQPHVVVDRDEAVRADASVEAMAKLRPLERNGTVTAGNAPGVNDGAAALILADAEYAAQHGYEALATIVDHATVAWDSPYISLTPAMAAQKLLDRTGYGVSRHCRMGDQRGVLGRGDHVGAPARDSRTASINQFGGAVAMGHPIGASGARIVGNGDQSAAQTRRRPRHRGYLFRRRPRRRAPRSGLTTRIATVQDMAPRRRSSRRLHAALLLRGRLALALHGEACPERAAASRRARRSAASSAPRPAASR